MRRGEHFIHVFYSERFLSASGWFQLSDEKQQQTKRGAQTSPLLGDRWLHGDPLRLEVVLVNKHLTLCVYF